MKAYHTSAMREEGFVLVAVLMILVMVSIIGISSIRTALTEQRIARNEMHFKETFYHADSGPYTVAKLVSRVIDEQTEQAAADFGFTYIHPKIKDEKELQNRVYRQIMGFDSYDGGGIYDVSFGNTRVDIKRNRTVNAPGSSVEFAGGDKGVGTGSKGGIHIYYSLDSTGLSEQSEKVKIIGEYRKVPDIAGGL